MIIFQLLEKSTGTTGWILRTSCVLFPGLTPKLLLFWTGTLIRLATGFCVAFRKASVFVAAAAVCSVATCVPSGATGASSGMDGLLPCASTAADASIKERKTAAVE